MLTIDNTTLLVIDVQGRLARIMDQSETLFANLERMIKGAQILGLPSIWTEQVPKMLGSTLPEFSELLIESSPPISKSSFSCCGEPTFNDALTATNSKQILMTGIESHVCVNQTTLDLLEQGYEVQLVTDAVSSRTAENKATALARMKTAGATLTSTEMALFELLRVAEGDRFRAISRLVK